MIVFLENARISFANGLWEKQSVNGGTPKYGCDFIIEPGKTVVKAVKADGSKVETTLDRVVAAVGQEAWPDNFNRVRATWERSQTSVRDGNLRTNDSGEVYAGYEDRQYVTAKNTVKPTVLDKDKTRLTEEDGKPYSGCYINAKIEIYANKKKGNQGIFASLAGVQFAGDGEAFGGGRAASEDDFDDLGGDDDLFSDGAAQTEDDLL